MSTDIPSITDILAVLKTPGFVGVKEVVGRYTDSLQVARVQTQAEHDCSIGMS